MILVAGFVTKSLAPSLIRITAIVLCVGGSMVPHFRLMRNSIQANLNGSQEKAM